MTSVHKESSHTTKTFSSTSGNNSSRGRNSANDFWDFDLPIRRKGRFFQDSSFEHERDEFDAAVRNVLKRWGETDLLSDTWDDDSLRSSNVLNRYRKMRAHNLKEDNQAVTITDDDTCHKIMLDVHDFMEGDVKVKLVGERELVVEGQMGNSNNTDLTSLASQNFRRRFSLPDITNMDAITSVMSSDGILTITAPKIVNRSKDGNSTVPINVTGNMKSNVTENYSSTSHSKASSDNSRLAETQGECDCEVCSQRYGAETTTNKQQRTHKVPVKINATLTETHHTSQTREPSYSCDSVDRNTEAKQGSNDTAESTIKKEVKSTYSNATVDGNHKMNQGSDHRENVSNVSTSANVASDTQHSTGVQGGTHTKAHSQKSTSTKTEFCDIPFSIRDSLPIKRKGHFFDDSFFDDTRTDFHKAVNDILREWGETDLLGDTWDDTNLRQSNNLNRYRKLRAHNLKEDNQAVTVTDDNTCHKIVLDVHDFMEGDVKVKLVGERELVVEGQMGNSNNTDLTSLASQTFRRRFSLPDITNMDAITSVMSSDGILTITAPKIVSQAKDEDFTIPIKVSGTVKSQAKGQFKTSSTSQATTDNSTSTKDSTMIDKQETECQKNESGQNITYSSEQKGGKSTSVKIDVADTNSATLSETDGSQKSCEHFTSRKTQEGSTSSSSQANTVSNRANDEIENQSEQKQNVSDISTQTSFISSSKMSEEKRSSSESNKGTTLPIKTRGLFFNDAFFEDTWKDYQDAVRDVVIKWGGQSTADDMTCYRKLRTRDMKEENQAVKASEDELNYKFVVDVQDFVKGGDVTVKAVDERELVVEGRVEKEEGGSRSTKRFLRRFVLPDNAQMESVSSVMSSDGVLTIMAPKKQSSLQGEADAVPASVNRSQERREKVSQITEQTVKTGTEADVPPSVRCKTDGSLGSSMSSVSTSSSALDESFRREGSSARHSSSVSSSDIKTSSDAMGHARGHVQEVQTGGSSEHKTDNWNLNSENTQQKNISCKIKIDYDEDDIGRESTGSKTLTFADENNETDAVNRRLERDHQSSKRDGDAATSDAWATDVGDVSQHYQFDEKYKNRSLPIKTRGLFSDDTFFRDCRLNFKTAIKDVLQKAKETPSSDDEVAAYRSLRRRDLKLENQAVHVDDDLSYQTIVLDVYDFLGGEVTVRVVEGRELVVEGRAKRKEGTSMTTLSFVRRFLLPDRADLETISAVMASDGVLVIVVPKLRRYSKLGASKGRELSSERQSRLDSEMGRGWMDRNMRESSRESQGRSCRSFMSSRLRESPEMFGESQRKGREVGPSWQERNMRDSSTDSEDSCHAFGSSRRSRHQHFSSDLF